MTEDSTRQRTESSSTQKRCVNLDWFEVHAREPIGEPHNADYFRSCGLEVVEREYGTRVYNEMFVINGSDGLPSIEIRRNPASSGLNGIHDAEETHIRLNNRMLYYDNVAEKFEQFLNVHHYERVRISRVDICLDFVRFDFGDDPSKFVRRYMKHRYAKYNGGDINAHGKDGWEGQDWNSLKWGSPTSIVSTKMYNKTMELKDAKTGLFGKPYIRQAWLVCGLIDDAQHVTLKGEEVNVWRVEFSLKSAKKDWAPIELDGHPNKKYSLRNTIDMYKGREKILTLFASLSRHYFRFKKYKKGVRKDRCEDKKLFDFSGVQQVYKLTSEQAVCGVGNAKMQKFNRLLLLLQQYDLTRWDGKTKEACDTLINALKEDNINADLAQPWNAADRAIARAMFVKHLIKNNVSDIVLKDALEEAFKVAPNMLQYFDFSGSPSTEP